MKTLFEIDRKDYTPDMSVTERYCVRAIIMRDGQLAVQRSAQGEYKLPGGGIEAGEQPIDTLRREVLEETGLHIRQNGIKELGEVIEKRKDVFDVTAVYVNHTYFYICEVEEKQDELSLTPEEAAKGYTAMFKPTSEIIASNDEIQKDYWRRRDTLFLKWFVENA